MSYNFDFDFIALVLYFIIIVNFTKSKHIYNSNTKVFLILLFTSLVTPIMDIIGGEVIVRQMSPGIVQFSNILYYLSEQATNFFFLLYFLSELEMRSVMSKFKQYVLVTPIVINMIVIATNPIHSWLFSYQNLTFASGWFRNVIIALPIFYFAWSIIYAVLNRSNMKKAHVNMIFTVTIINTVARLIQRSYSNLLLHCLAVALSITIIYFQFLAEGEGIDPLTGIATKSYLEKKAKKYYYNNVEFNSILIRITDYDHLTTQMGIDTTERLIRHIAHFINRAVDKDDVFQLSNNCFVIVSENEFPLAMVEAIDARLSEAWEVGGMEVFCSHIISQVKSSTICKDYESYLAFLSYFQDMRISRKGIIKAEELNITDQVRFKSVEGAIDKAIEKKSFEVYYQPICTTVDQKFVTAEALVRLNDEALGFISPAEFIPIAERTGRILSVGEIVLEKVCEFLKNTDISQYGLQYIEVNLSAMECIQKEFINRVDSIINKYGIDHSMISFEITETASNSAPAVFAENLGMLHDRGFKLALDDFGTGYSNLQRLVTSSFDIIKFDKDMIQTTCNNPGLHLVVKRLIGLFHTMGKKIVAEGVETINEYEFLKSAECDFIQGYYFSKPIPSEEFLSFLSKHS